MSHSEWNFGIDPILKADLESHKIPNSALTLRAIKEQGQEWEADAPEREKFLQWLHAHPWAVLIDGKPKLTTEMTVLAWEARRARAPFEKPAHYIAEVAK